MPQSSPPDPSLEHEEYFASNPPPSFLASHTNQAQDFISHHAAVPGQRVVLVTSGGTTVPLETNMVRFVDNFSAGTRGATSAEWFLRQGYAVIFLHREFSLLPFARHYSHSSHNCFLDYLSPSPPSSSSPVTIASEYQTKMASVLHQYRQARDSNRLLLLPFTTVNDYLWTLRRIAQLLHPLGSRALFYLAAAVSDFFIPRRKMVEHKIQSSEDFASAGPPPDTAATIQDKKLIVNLDPVPKFLKTLVESWSPAGMIVSFKLETDPKLLVTKARYALEKYGHHLVVGNLLSTRKWEVVFVALGEGREVRETWIRVPRQARASSVSGIPGNVGLASTVRGREGAEVNGGSGEDEKTDRVAGSEEEAKNALGDPEIEIESLMVPEIANLHAAHIKRIDEGTGKA
ncbi:DFP-domain-containing protein [Myriangium duriaei CBS 260.36]|uniref:DFP-domain-containing protein n=1 Tax=Myriangium duriaei CBS 260.36 TaxID=1168546 RepID=A0A9P4IUU1_9PEZI|nr:DFP-domain-containing protein [Myriangium duriaei CBS 260.36]